MNTNLEEIKNCTIEKIIFSSEDGYTVAAVRTEDNNFVATFQGSYKQGQKLDLIGEWYVHSKYGRQFKVVFAEMSREVEESDIEIFLQNIKGIGPVRARKIVAAFGRDALQVIEENPERLREIGIPQSVVDSVSAEITQNKEFNEIKLELLPLGFSLNMIKKLYDRYGSNTLVQVKANPYKIAEEVDGIGFIKADEIAVKFGIEKDNTYRIQSGLKYTLYLAETEGHLYLPITTLCKAASEKILKVGYTKVLDQALYLTAVQELYDDKGKVYLPKNFYSEKYIAEKIVKMLNEEPWRISSIDELIKEAGAAKNIRYSPKQKEAIKKAVENNISIITGGPGTGKTTIVSALLYIFQKQDKLVALASPTGKAAKRLEEVTGYPAKTIHRLLEARFDKEFRSVRFFRNELNPLDEDVVIVDEFSMVDNELAASLLKALREDAKLIIIGDMDQLPSVGAGNVLRDLIESGVIPVTKLDVIFRQEETSGIIINSKLIKEGKMVRFNNKDFIFHELVSPEQVVEEFVKELEKGKTLDDVQILTPMKKTDIGTLELNRLIQERINPPHPQKEEITYGSKIFRVGDKVMQTQNNYEKEIFNGDTGYVKRAYRDEEGLRHVVIDFDGRIVDLVEEELKEIIPAYAITIHKSQGSEYDTVIVVIAMNHYIMLKRNLLYTAVTRARNIVKIFGDMQALKIAINTIDSSKRYTALKERLKEQKEQMERGILYALEI
ncbi:ATP-dependent RecD-like DNA helicase [Thermoanaerobacter sp. CM-CNRG TB177]|uniref:SF1B family DNA helicase RecD2 n=1 Tax=Thermoanaerobacter sp. CM-CNRG TB177 TaxID=2800659 RepID=UPI001BDF63F3|nr:ATP-dependent RecD-like DNA helicase [Thermoanaerobacter sp. CM-CNRG TB177]MBT1278930.1 ATP-dependent RecD-like DNA helicase [Thermoanaerobacter sp. CM-CNRG TB177]